MFLSCPKFQATEYPCVVHSIRSLFSFMESYLSSHHDSIFFIQFPTTISPLADRTITIPANFLHDQLKLVVLNCVKSSHVPHLQQRLTAAEYVDHCLSHFLCYM